MAVDKQTRKVKIQPKYRNMVNGSKIIPEIRLNGNWLEQAGFKAGAMVEVITSANELIIKVL